MLFSVFYKTFQCYTFQLYKFSKTVSNSLHQMSSGIKVVFYILLLFIMNIIIIKKIHNLTQRFFMEIVMYVEMYVLMKS